jgi:hypothetical protein
MEGGEFKQQGKEGWMKLMDDAVLYSFNDTKDFVAASTLVPVGYCPVLRYLDISNLAPSPSACSIASRLMLSGTLR